MSARGPKRLRGLRQAALAHGPVEGHADYDAEHATTIGCAADEAGLDQVFEHTHDFLIEHLGPLRRSGITWRQWQGRNAIALLDKLEKDDGPSADIDQYRAFLTEHPDGFLVMASCAAVRRG